MEEKLSLSQQHDKYAQNSPACGAENAFGNTCLITLALSETQVDIASSVGLEIGPDLIPKKLMS
ncbi:MAG: hypothetical protein OXH84_04795 [Gammaproteobacteria bacterium]|nr:hypothetical protein [Gammaproteobacteria bacterium]